MKLAWHSINIRKPVTVPVVLSLFIILQNLYKIKKDPYFLNQKKISHAKFMKLSQHLSKERIQYKKIINIITFGNSSVSTILVSLLSVIWKQNSTTTINFLYTLNIY